MQPFEELAVKAAALSRSSPNLWADFLLALGSCVERQTETLVNSPIPDLQINQGKVQALQNLHRNLTDAVKIADKLNGKQK